MIHGLVFPPHASTTTYADFALPCQKLRCTLCQSCLCYCSFLLSMLFKATPVALSTTARGWFPFFFFFFLSSQRSSLDDGVSLSNSDELPLIVLSLCGYSGMVLSVCTMVLYYGLVLSVLFFAYWFSARVGSFCCVDLVRLSYLFTF